MAKKQEYRVALVLSWAVYMYFLCIHSNKRREKKVDGVQSPKERRRDTICEMHSEAEERERKSGDVRTVAGRRARPSTAGPPGATGHRHDGHPAWPPPPDW
jgi:hypothetical protein